MPSPTDFRWIEWNIAKLEKHGVSIPEAESVVRRAGRGYPRKIGDKKWLVVGRGRGDRVLQVIYLLDPDNVTAFIIHAMPVTTRRRRRRR